ncbi:MAG: phenylacetate--CoA ligase family protein, partial [Pseudomonadota bacterium]
MTETGKQHFDGLETRTPKSREKAIFGLLPDILDRAKSHAPGWAKHLAHIVPTDIDTRAALATLPVLRKAALKDLQSESPPFGGFATAPAGDMMRAFLSPGPIFEPEGRGDDWWRSARALYAAGFRKGDLVHNTFSYHLTPGGWILDAGARAIGCAVFPAGPGNTEQQIEAIKHLQPTAFIGVPDSLKILLDKASEAGREVTSFKRAMVSGGALFPSLRQDYQARGIDVFQTYATADLGIIAYESSALEGMIVDEG